ACSGSGGGAPKRRSPRATAAGAGASRASRLRRALARSWRRALTSHSSRPAAASSSARMVRRTSPSDMVVALPVALPQLLALQGLAQPGNLGRMRVDAQRHPAVALFAVGGGLELVPEQLLHGDHVVVEAGDFADGQD